MASEKRTCFYVVTENGQAVLKSGSFSVPLSDLCEGEHDLEGQTILVSFSGEGLKRQWISQKCGPIYRADPYRYSTGFGEGEPRLRTMATWVEEGSVVIKGHLDYPTVIRLRPGYTSGESSAFTCLTGHGFGRFGIFTWGISPGLKTYACFDQSSTPVISVEIPDYVDLSSLVGKAKHALLSSASMRLNEVKVSPLKGVILITDPDVSEGTIAYDWVMVRIVPGVRRQTFIGESKGVPIFESGYFQGVPKQILDTSFIF